MEAYFLTAAIAILIYMLLFFIASLVLKDMSVVDIGWGFGFVTVALVLLFMGESLAPYRLLVTAFVAIWGSRLGIFLWIRNAGKPEDFRYRQWRKEWGKSVVLRSFFQVFLLQGLILWLVSFPVIVALGAAKDVDLSDPVVAVGGLVWLIGFLFESIGDYQKYRFKQDPANEGKFIQSGLWKFSRHPNYFGDATVWWGIFLVAVPAGAWYLSIIGPLVISYFLVFVSGVPMLERKYEGNAAYEAYKKRTSGFFPWFPKNA